MAVCIVGFRNRDDIQHCLAALERTRHRDFEVVICENGGSLACETVRRSIAAAKPLGQPVEVICAPSNLGYAGGVNLCIDRTPSADAWWILNPDTVPAPDALEWMCERLARGDCEAAGCTVHNADGRVGSRGGRWNRWLARAIAIDNGKPVADGVSREFETGLAYVSGASMLVGRTFLERTGKMREDYFLYGEEVEWCLRGLARGLRLGVAARANVLHHQGTTTGSATQLPQRGRLPVFLDERNKLLITRDCFPGLLPVVTLGALAMLILRFARRGAWAQVGYALDGWWSGLRNQRGKPAWVAD